MRLPLTNLPVPTPGDLLGLAGDLRAGVSDALDLVPRAAELISRAGALVGRIDTLLDSAELLLVRVESLVDQVSETSVDAATAVTRVGSVTDDAAQLLETAGVVSRKADRLVEGGSGLLNRSDHLLGSWSPVLADALPVAQKVTESISPDEVDAAVGLLDRLPRLLTHLDEDVLPMLRQLDAVGPDVHAILEIVDDLRDVIAGLPGAGLLRKMGDRKDVEPDPSS